MTVQLSNGSKTNARKKGMVDGEITLIKVAMSLR